MFEAFDRFDIDTGEAVIHGVAGGAGPALLLLHGYPQSHAIWHRVAPLLAPRFSVVAPDLRGYGRSSKPASTADHATYSKRASASDMVRLMERLGHRRFAVAGHDRGGRVAHRMALDWPDRVTRIAVLDIAPTREMYRDATAGLARDYWHWFWLILPEPQPERMIGADPEAFLRFTLGQGRAGMAPFAEAALADYIAAMRDPATIHAMCEDYRAAISIDIAHDDADGGARLTCPVLALWGAHGVIEKHFDCLALWRERAIDVRGEALPGGHYLPEELPDAVAERLARFFTDTEETP